MHLRHRLGRDLHGDDVHRAGGRAPVARPAAGRPRRAALPPQRRQLSCAAPSACAATRSSCSRPIWRTAPGASRCSATRSRASPSSIRSTGAKTDELALVKIYSNSHYVTPKPTLQQAIKSIKAELKQRLDELYATGQLLEAQRLEQRTVFDMEMMEATGSLRRHRELFALSHRPQARRAAADAVRVPARQRARVRRREPRHRAADRRHVPRRLPAQGDARRVRLPPALLHGQPPAALRGMGRHAAADRVRLGDARRLGAGADRRRLRRAGDPPDRPHRSARRCAPGQDPGRRPARRGAPGLPRRLPHARHHAHQAHGRGPHRVHARAGHPRALHALRHRDAGAHRDHPRPAARRLRRADRHQPAARGPRHPRVRARRHPRRRQGRLPALGDLAHPDHRPRGAQRRRPRDPLRRPDDRLHAARHRRDRAGGARSRRPTTPSTASRPRASSATSTT